MTSLKPSKGRLLVAEPTIIGDVSFNRSVVLLAEENESGFIGFILNKPLEYTINDLIPDVNSNITVFNGGPVEQDNMYFMHKIPDLIPNSIEISNGIYWGGDFDTVTMLLENKLITDKEIRFFLGYSGWDANQLEQELNSNSWIVVNNTYSNGIFSIENASFWKEKMKEFGGDYLIWSNAPENPNFN